MSELTCSNDLIEALDKSGGGRRQLFDALAVNTNFPKENRIVDGQHFETIGLRQRPSIGRAQGDAHASSDQSKSGCEIRSFIFSV